MESKLHIKLGEHELDVAGDPTFIQQERLLFYNMIAVVHAQKESAFSDSSTPKELRAQGVSSCSDAVDPESMFDYIHSKELATLSEITLFCVYYEEIFLGKRDFDVKDIKRYFIELRKPVPKNCSQIISTLERKGFVTKSKGSGATSAYHLTAFGLTVCKDYETDPLKTKKLLSHNQSNRKYKTGPVTVAYTQISADDLNLSHYPDVQEFSAFKDRMILALYIITNEGKGEYFYVRDIIYLMHEIFGEPVTHDQVTGVCKTYSTWFKVEPNAENNRSKKRKLLAAGKNYAENLIWDHNRQRR